VANWLGATFDVDQFEKFRESKIFRGTVRGLAASGHAARRLLHYCARSTGFQHLLTCVNSISSANQKVFRRNFQGLPNRTGRSAGCSITAPAQLVFSIF
jgi:hypothetical protein